MSGELAEIKAELDRAKAAHIEISRQLGDAERAAIQAVRADFADRIAQAKIRLRAADKAERDYIDQTSTHPWEGKRVFYLKNVHARWGSHVIRQERLEGVVEVVRQSSQFPSSMTYGRPRLGKVIVRKVKKDGTASLQFHDYPSLEHWSLAQGSQQG